VWSEDYGDADEDMRSGCGIQPIRSALPVAALPLAGLAADNRLTPRETAARRTLLFNGRNFGHREDAGRKSPARDSSGVADRGWNAVAHAGFVEGPFGDDNYGDFESDSASRWPGRPAWRHTARRRW
jgi:hypothetical protein